jgi:hypothetical protein
MKVDGYGNSVTKRVTKVLTFANSLARVRVAFSEGPRSTKFE